MGHIAHRARACRSAGSLEIESLRSLWRLTAVNSSSVVKALAAGVLGACAVTVAHELLRRFLPRAPRMEVLGMRSIARLSRAVGQQPPDRLHDAALMGDIFSNAGYYSLVGVAGRERALYVGAGLGLAAGLGAVTLPGPLGLGTAP